MKCGKSIKLESNLIDLRLSSCQAFGIRGDLTVPSHVLKKGKLTIVEYGLFMRQENGLLKKESNQI
jgi:hypothetical protein